AFLEAISEIPPDASPRAAAGSLLESARRTLQTRAAALGVLGPEGAGISEKLCAGFLDDDPFVDPLLASAVDADGCFQRSDGHSFLGLPLRLRGKTVGALLLADKEGGEAFTDDDALFAGLFAAQLAVVLGCLREATAVQRRTRFFEVLTDNAPAAMMFFD